MNIIIKKQKPFPKSLEELFLSDTDNIIPSIKSATEKQNNFDKELQLFEPIKDFIAKHQRLPQEDSSELNEQRLAYNLKNIKLSHQEAYNKFMAQHKTFINNISDNKQLSENKVSDKIYTSLEEVFTSDEFNILSGSDILDQAPISKRTLNSSAKKPDYIAKTKQCTNFDIYKPCFDKIKLLISQKVFDLEPVKEFSGDLNTGEFYILKGQYVLIANADKEHIKIYGTHQHFRVKIIIENGTEYSPMNRSFIRSLYKSDNSFKILPIKKEGENFLKELKDYLQNPSSDGNQPTGYLYVLRSKSNNQALQQFMQTSDLLKIGFCSTTVAERIANAKNSPTYLCSEVEVCQTYKCTGEINTHKVERLVHALLNEHRLNITLKDHKGQSYRPQEWFTVPLQTVEQIIAHILDGTIQNYRVDPIRGKLVKIKS